MRAGTAMCRMCVRVVFKRACTVPRPHLRGFAIVVIDTSTTEWYYLPASTTWSTDCTKSFNESTPALDLHE